ncbi:MAG: PAS domain-containing protein [Gammaproteobacteria bacterium]|nr:PAS domain-containing protein [Gammaproteobacteria bacterium]
MGWILIFKAISDPVAVVDQYGWIVYANPAWGRLTGQESQPGVEPYHITRDLPALNGAGPGIGTEPVEETPMMINAQPNQMIAVTVTARPLPGAALMVVQARASQWDIRGVIAR